MTNAARTGSASRRLPRPADPGALRARLALAVGLFAAGGAHAALRIATWNLEWLMTPATHTALRATCTVEGQPPRRSERSIPCDVARQSARNERDFERLRWYAHELDADVVALQEVDGASAAAQVFPNHDFCFTARTAVQNNGFAIRRGRGIRFRCGDDLRALALGHEQLRWGAELRLYPPQARELRILNVHLKSGCAGQPLETSDGSCQLLEQQIEPIKRWIAAQVRSDGDFMVIGDFNRRFVHERGGTQGGMWAQLDRTLAGTRLIDAAASRRYVKCRLTEPHSGYIDHIVGGERAAAHWLPYSFRQISYAESDAARFRLSDHCPLAIDYQ